MDTAKWLILTLLACVILSTASALCGIYTTDCNLLNELDCPNYYSNTTGTNMTCVWNVAICEELEDTCDYEPSSSSSEASSSSSALSSSSTSAPTTAVTTTVPLGSCGVGEIKIIWSVIGVTSSYMEECYFYPNGTLLRCFHANNETICLPPGTDWMKITRPTTLDMLTNPEGAVETIFGIARPTLALFALFFILIVILALGYTLFRPLLSRRGY